MKAAMKKTNKKQTALRAALKKALPRLYNPIYNGVDIFDEYNEGFKNNTGVCELIDEVADYEEIKKIIESTYPKEYALLDKLDLASAMLQEAKYDVSQRFDKNPSVVLATCEGLSGLGNNCDIYNTSHVYDFCVTAILVDIDFYRYENLSTKTAA